MTLNPANACRCGNYNPKLDAREPWRQNVWWFPTKGQRSPHIEWERTALNKQLNILI